MKIEKKSFGIIPNRIPATIEAGKYEGREIFNYTLIADNGASVVVTEFGACIVTINVPDKDGNIDNVNLCYDDLWGYMNNGSSFGAVVGRNANRIRGAKYTLNGVEYKIKKNDGTNNLHSGGANNYGLRPYETVDFGADEKKAFVKFHLFSPHMDQGFPGNMDFYVTYTFDNDGNLSLIYNAKSDMDTICNVTNHSYFNLGGDQSGDARNSLVWIDADYVTNTSAGNIPNGRMMEVAGTPFDFNTAKPIIQDFYAKHHMLPKGYDCNYVLKNNGKLAKVAYFKHPTNGRKMEIFTDLPGMQMYTGNYVSSRGRNGKFYKDFGGICFESQYHPNAINIDSFESPILKAGEEFNSTTIYRFCVEE